MWAWQNLFQENCKEREVEVMKSSRCWEITKPKFAIIDENVFCTLPPDGTTALHNEALDRNNTKHNQSESRDVDGTEPPELQPQRETGNETTSSAEMKSPDSEKQLEWVISKEVYAPSSKEHRTMLSDIKEVPKGTCGNFVIRLEMNEPGEKLLEKAKQELRETEEVEKESIARLQELLRAEQEEHGLIVPIENIAWLKRFLRPTHFYPESAFLKIQNYYKFKIEAKNKKLIEHLKPSAEENFFTHGIITVLPQRDQHGRRILLVEIGRKWNYSQCTLDELFKGTMLFLEAALLEPETQISGTVLIFDMDGLDAWQIFHFTINPVFVFRVVDLIQKVSPIRIKGIHVVNQPLTFGRLLKLFTILMEEKYQKRIHIHGADRESLHQHIDKDCLPPEYEGTCDVPRISGLKWLQTLSMLDKEYEAVNIYGYKKVMK